MEKVGRTQVKTGPTSGVDYPCRSFPLVIVFIFFTSVRRDFVHHLVTFEAISLDVLTRQLTLILARSFLSFSVSYPVALF